MQAAEGRAAKAEEALESRVAAAAEARAACEAAAKELAEVKQRARALLEEKDAQLQAARVRRWVTFVKVFTSTEINERRFIRSFTHMLPGPYTTLSNNGVSSREKTSPRSSTEPNHQTDFEFKIHMNRDKLVNRLCLVITPNGVYLYIIMKVFT